MKEQLRGLQPYKPGKQIDDVRKELGLEKIVKLASNENPFGCSPHVAKSLTEVLDEVAIYPDGYATELRFKLAEKLGVHENELIFGNGTDEIIHMISRCILMPGYNSIMATPTFPQYKRNVVIDGATPIEVPLVNGRHDLETMASKIDDKTKVIWLCNPNNPTGEYIRKDELVDFLNKVPSQVFVVLDEAYIEYVTAPDFPDAQELQKTYKNLIFTRTFSKIYGLAGLRIGYAVADPDIIRMLEPAREPFNVTRLSQKAASVAVDDQAFIEACRDKNRNGLQQYYEFCHAYNVKYFPSEGNFILIDINESGDKLFDFLLKRGYIVRSGEALGYPNGVRITIGNEEQNAAIIELLKEYFS